MVAWRLIESSKTQLQYWEGKSHRGARSSSSLRIGTQGSEMLAGTLHPERWVALHRGYSRSQSSVVVAMGRDSRTHVTAAMALFSPPPTLSLQAHPRARCAAPGPTTVLLVLLLALFPYLSYCVSLCILFSLFISCSMSLYPFPKLSFSLLLVA